MKTPLGWQISGQFHGDLSNFWAHFDATWHEAASLRRWSSTTPGVEMHQGWVMKNGCTSNSIFGCYIFLHSLEWCKAMMGFIVYLYIYIYTVSIYYIYIYIRMISIYLYIYIHTGVWAVHCMVKTGYPQYRYGHSASGKAMNHLRCFWDSNLLPMMPRGSQGFDIPMATWRDFGLLTGTCPRNWEGHLHPILRFRQSLQLTDCSLIPGRSRFVSDHFGGSGDQNRLFDFEHYHVLSIYIIA